MICLNCGKGKAIKDNVRGYLSCKTCIDKQRVYNTKEAIEITTPTIKESRKEYKKDIIQRYRSDIPSKEYIKAYGSKGFTPEEVKRAKNVWTENTFYKED